MEFKRGGATTCRQHWSQKSQAAGVRPFPPELPLFQGGGVGGVVVWEAGREVVEPWRERREQRLEEMAWGESG